MSKKYPLVVNRVRYESIAHLAEAYGVPYASLWHRIVKKGLSPKAAVELPLQKRVSKPIKAFSKTFPTISAAARAYDQNPEIVRQKIKKGMSAEDALMGHNRRRKTITAFGDEYQSIADLAREYDIKLLTLRSRLRSGLTPEDAVTRPIIEIKDLEVDGRSFESLAELCRTYKKPYKLVHKRIRRFGWSPKDAVNLPKVIGQEIKAHGRTYKTIVSASKVYGMDPNLVRYRLIAGWSPENALDKNAPVDNKKSITIDNEFFSTYSEAARTYDLKEVTFMKRIRGGWSPEEAAGLLPPPKKRIGTRPISPKAYRKRLKEIHGDALDFSRAEFRRAHDNVEVICNQGKRHQTFTATPNNLLGGKGCPICKLSHGAKRIARWLEAQEIFYKTEWTKHDLRSTTYDRATLRFDFYLPKTKILIEYDGEQHFQPVRFGNMTMEDARNAVKKTKTNDLRKNRWAKANGFKMIRVRFDES